jgi:transcriptional regulator with XRE-family HTH domain
MELKDRVKIARQNAGLSQSELARRIGIAPQAIQAIESGRVRQTKHILAMSRELDVSPEYLSGETVNLNFRTPIIGIARAGTEDILYEVGQSNLGDTEPPEMSTDKTVALEVRGSSMGGRIEDGDLVFYEDRREPVTPDLYGKVCVIGCSDGRVLIKRIKAGSRPGLFHLVSYSAEPEFDVAVDWAARVTSIRPK